MENEKTIWDNLKGRGLSDYAVAGIMGNIRAESNGKPTNLQNSYERSLKMTDASYTRAVDDGTYTNFVRDQAGYGLAQWTYWTRKQALFDYAKSRNASIGDLNMQLDYLWKELNGYTKMMNTVKNATSVRVASDAIVTQYERPADQSEKALALRASYGQAFYDKYASTAVKKSTEEIAEEVINGLWGTGAERKSKLQAAGYDYNAVQSAVNARLSKANKTLDAVAKEVIAGLWGTGVTRRVKLMKAGYDYAAVQKRVNELLK